MHIPWLPGIACIFLTLLPPAAKRVETHQNALRCKAVSSQGLPRVTLSMIRRFLPGEYTLEVVLTSVAGRDTVARGRMSLQKSPSRSLQKHNPSLIYPVYGWTDLDLASTARVSLAYSPASRDTLRPGVQGVYNALDSTLTLVLGNALRPEGLSGCRCAVSGGGA
jgi:hypothetical protein